MPVIRDPTKAPNTDQSWSKLQRSVSHELPLSIRNTAQAIRKIQRMRRGR